jgi:class 3 adenylate cyclase
MGSTPGRSLYIKIPALTVLVLILGGLLPLAACYILLHRNADREVMDTASVLLAAAQPARTLTPSPAHIGEPGCDYARRATIDTEIPRSGEPSAKIRYVAHSPTNPLNEADRVESQLVDTFQNSPDRHRIDQFIDKRDGRYLMSAAPISLSQDRCLKCHSVPQIAPIIRVKTYPKGGFGWKKDQIVGATVVYVPSDPPHQQATGVLITTAEVLIPVVLLCIGFLVWRIQTSVCKPLIGLAESCEFLRDGNWNAKFTGGNNDEVSNLALSFQRTVAWLRDRIAREEKLRAMFQQFVPASVAARALGKDPAKLLAGARHPVTVLHLNIRNFKLLMEHLPPEETVTTLNEFFTSVNAVIVKHHGIVSKYLGDSILAFFGMPVEDEYHALNAVRAAVGIPPALQDLYVRLDEKFGWELGVGIGISTGEPIVGHFGAAEHMEYTVLGDVVIESMQLEVLTKGVPEEDTILISESTYRCVMSDVHVLDVGERECPNGMTTHAYAVQGFRSEARKALAA